MQKISHNRTLLRDYSCHEVIEDSLLSLCKEETVKLNIFCWENELIRLCDAHVDGTLKNIKLAMNWLRSFSTNFPKHGWFRETIKKFCSDEYVEVVLLLGILDVDEASTFPCNRLAVSNNKTAFHIKYFQNSLKDTTKYHPTLTHQESEKSKALGKIATVSCGSFSIVHLTTQLSTCTAGCTVWPVVCSEPFRVLSGNAIEQFFVHLCVNYENQLYLRSSDTTYLNLPLEHQPVLLSHTAALPDCPHVPVCKGPCCWTRIKPSGRILTRLNNCLKRCAEDQIEANRWWLHWSAQDLHVFHLLRGKHVLARRREDGHFYEGIVHEVKSGGIFDMVIVRFGPFLGKFRLSENRNGDKKNGADEYRYESVPIYDIIDMSHASRHRISAGDKVLARGLWPVPVSSGNKKDTHHNIRHIRYLPATVFEEMVNEELPNEADKRKFPPSEDSATNVRVELALPGPRAGCYKLPKANVVWIPTAVFERIVLEQLLPTEAREWVHHKTFPLGIYPDTAAPGYPHEDSQRLSFWRSSLAIHPIQYVQLEVGREKQLDCNPEPQTAPVILVTKELNSIARATHSWRENPVESNQSSEVDRIKIS